MLFVKSQMRSKEKVSRYRNNKKTQETHSKFEGWETHFYREKNKANEKRNKKHLYGNKPACGIPNIYKNPYPIEPKETCEKRKNALKYF